MSTCCSTHPENEVRSQVAHKANDTGASTIKVVAVRTSVLPDTMKKHEKSP